MDAANGQPRHVNGWLIGKQGAHRRAVRPLTKWASARQTGSEVDPPAPPLRYSPYPHATSPISQGRKPSCIANPICPRRSAPSACAPSAGGASGRAVGRRFATAASVVATLVTAASNLWESESDGAASCSWRSAERRSQLVSHPGSGNLLSDGGATAGDRLLPPPSSEGAGLLCRHARLRGGTHPSGPPRLLHDPR